MQEKRPLEPKQVPICPVQQPQAVLQPYLSLKTFRGVGSAGGPGGRCWGPEGPWEWAELGERFLQSLHLL